LTNTGLDMGERIHDDVGEDLSAFAYGNPYGSPGLRSVNDMESCRYAINAAWHADAAAKSAEWLLELIQSLWSQIGTLQYRVEELEEWKRRTLDEMTKLRFEHKQLRKKLWPEHEVDEVVTPNAKSVQIMLAEHVDPSNATCKAPVKGKGLSLDESQFSLKGLGPPPGLEVRFGGGAAPSEALAESKTFTTDITAVSSTSETSSNVAQGLHVAKSSVDGTECMRAEWRIGHLSAKLKGCMGRPLVSVPFSAFGLEDLRLMVFPEGKEVVKGPRSKRQKDQYAKKVTEGPLEGCLKLKVPDAPEPHVLEYYLRVGSTRRGPFRHNFAECIVNGCADFGIDWLTQVDSDQSLTVTVEIVSAPPLTVVDPGAMSSQM